MSRIETFPSSEKKCDVELMERTEEFNNVNKVPSSKINSCDSKSDRSSRIFVETVSLRWSVRDLFLCWDFSSPGNEFYFYSPVCRVDSSDFRLALTFKPHKCHGVHTHKKIILDNHTIGIVEVRLEKSSKDSLSHHAKYQIYSEDSEETLDGDVFSGEEAFLFSDSNPHGKMMSFQVVKADKEMKDCLTVCCKIQVLRHKYVECKKVAPPTCSPKNEGLLEFFAAIALFLFFLAIMLFPYDFLLKDVKAHNCTNYHKDVHQLFLQASCKLLRISEALNQSQDYFTHYLSHRNLGKNDSFISDPVNITSLTEIFAIFCHELI